MRVVAVNKCLDKKLLMFGFEVPDLLAIFITLSTLNFMFGRSGMAFLLVWLPTLTLAAVLRYGKKGKPDKFLVHWLRFQIKPGVFSGWAPPQIDVTPPRLRRDA